MLTLRLVVLAACKVIMLYVDVIAQANKEKAKELLKKLRPPLVTLLSKEPEIQYVALRNLELICQRHKGLLGQDLKVFFCKYNDPLYVKLEKLELLIMLASEKTIDQVLLEFKEYATKVSIFVLCEYLNIHFLSILFLRLMLSSSASLFAPLVVLP